MKKVIVVLSLLIGLTGFTQESDMHLADAMNLVRMTSESEFEVLLNPLKKMIPVEDQEAFMAEVKASMSELYEKIAILYAKSFTHEEIKTLLTFYKSPFGLKFLKKTAEITEESIEFAEAWAMKLMPIVQKYMGESSKGLPFPEQSNDSLRKN